MTVVIDQRIIASALAVRRSKSRTRRRLRIRWAKRRSTIHRLALFHSKG